MIDLESHILIPPNLAALGVKRQGDGKAADLVTIYRTPYPVLKNYRRFCEVAGLEPFAGGTYTEQGENWKAGFITSGYRDDLIDGRTQSPHLHAIAIDVVIGSVHKQLAAAPIAVDYFTRLGLYPFNGFIHLDLATREWMVQHGGRRFWFRDAAGKYHSFDQLDKLMKTVQDHCGV